MTTLKFLTAFLLIALYSCGQKLEKRKSDPAAIELNNKAMELVTFLDNDDSARKALSLLDQATNIDSNYFLGYYNKLMFLNQLNQFDKAAFIVDKMIALRPHAHDLYLMGGILRERLGDTILSKNYFQKSLSICNAVLDTMSTKNSDYDMLFMNRAITLIMLGNETKGNELLKQLYDRQIDDIYSEMLLPFMNKNKNELLKFITEQKYGH